MRLSGQIRDCSGLGHGKIGNPAEGEGEVESEVMARSGGVGVDFSRSLWYIDLNGLRAKEVKLANFQSEREQLALLENLFKQKQFTAGLAQMEPVLQQFPSSFHLKFLQIKFFEELQHLDQALRSLLEMHARFGDNISDFKGTG